MFPDLTPRTVMTIISYAWSKAPCSVSFLIKIYWDNMALYYNLAVCRILKTRSKILLRMNKAIFCQLRTMKNKSRITPREWFNNNSRNRWMSKTSLNPSKIPFHRTWSLFPSGNPNTLKRSSVFQPWGKYGSRWASQRNSLTRLSTNSEEKGSINLTKIWVIPGHRTALKS